MKTELTQAEAIKLHESNFWQDMTPYEKVRFQLFESRLCMPFSVFHEAIEKELKRPVYTHEFGLNLDGLKREFLGVESAPSFEDIINLIPKDKRIIIAAI